MPQVYKIGEGWWCLEAGPLCIEVDDQPIGGWAIVKGAALLGLFLFPTDHYFWRYVL